MRRAKTTRVSIREYYLRDREAGEGTDASGGTRRRGFHGAAVFGHHPESHSNSVSNRVLVLIVLITSTVVRTQVI